MASNRLWPTLDTRESCSRAIKDGSLAAFISAGVSAAVAVMSIATGKPFLGFNGWSLVDAGLIAIFGWRIRAGSLPWVATTIVYWIVNFTNTLADGGRPGVVAFIFLLAYVNAGRAIVARRRLRAASLSAATPQT